MRFNILVTAIALQLFCIIGAVAQTPEIISTQSPTDPEAYQFSIEPLEPSTKKATYSHLWWFGDNSFSLEAEPTHSPNPSNQTSGGQYFMYAIPTENYGTLGPPPLRCSAPSSTTYSDPARILETNEQIHVQAYRNAVLYDTLYLIVTYGTSDVVGRTAQGKLTVHLPEGASLLTEVIDNFPDFLPNAESFISGSNDLNNPVWSFSGLKKDEQRSILLPIRLDTAITDSLDFQVDFWKEGDEAPSAGNYVRGSNYYDISVAVALSHDPNRMHEKSDAKLFCMYGGKEIRYTTEFQNEGDFQTTFVRLVVQLDKSIDMKSIEEVVLHGAAETSVVEEARLNGRYKPKAGSIYAVDKKKRTLTIELNDLKLLSSTDPRCRDRSLTKASISFSTKVKKGHIFGKPIKAFTSIVFDQNDPIVTKKVSTCCKQPLTKKEIRKARKGDGPKWGFGKRVIVACLFGGIGFLGFKVLHKNEVIG